MAVSEGWPVQHASHRQAKVGPEGMDDHGGSNIIGLLKTKKSYFGVRLDIHSSGCLSSTCVLKWTNPQDLDHDVLVDRKDGDLQDSHNKKLDRTGFAQHSPERDKNCCRAEVRIDHPFMARKEKILKTEKTYA